MTAPTPTPDPLARFRELAEQFPHRPSCALVSLMRDGPCDCDVPSIRAALLAEAERLVEIGVRATLRQARLGLYTTQHGVPAENDFTAQILAGIKTDRYALAAGVEDREAGPDVVFEAVVQDRAALLAIASYGDKLTGQERTLHHDLIGIARRALAPAPDALGTET